MSNDENKGNIGQKDNNNICLMKKGDYTVHILIEEIQGIEQKIKDKLPKPI